MSRFQVFLIVLYLFFFGGVGGWGLELFFRRFFSGANPERKWLNPGFLFGPCLPLYGFGTVLLFILSELDHTLFGSFSGTFWYYPVMFVVMALAMTLLEYIVGLVSFKGFHLRLWDYSKLWGNIQGIICPLFTFFWGVLSLGYYFLLYPRLRKLVEWFVAHPLASFMVGVCFGIFLIDLCFSVHLGAVVQKKAAQIDKSVYDAIDVQKLSDDLGIPVVPISAVKNQGVDELVKSASTPSMNSCTAAQAAQIRRTSRKVVRRSEEKRKKS